MKEAHKGMGITDAEFDVIVVHLRAALVKNGVKTDDVAFVVATVRSARRDIVEGQLPPAEIATPKGQSPRANLELPKDSSSLDMLVTMTMALMQWSATLCSWFRAI